jgi:transposase InsO family protein
MAEFARSPRTASGFIVGGGGRIGAGARDKPHGESSALGIRQAEGASGSGGALARRRPAPGLVHHSDRGVQYASRDYTQLLQEHGIQISMSRKGNPWDNAACESFIKTLKYEEVYRTVYRDLADARASVGAFLEKVYNQKRLHSALGYLPPAEFEHGWHSQTNKEAAARQLSL